MFLQSLKIYTRTKNSIFVFRQTQIYFFGFLKLCLFHLWINFLLLNFLLNRLLLFHSEGSSSLNYTFLLWLLLDDNFESLFVSLSLLLSFDFFLHLNEFFQFQTFTLFFFAQSTFLLSCEFFRLKSLNFGLLLKVSGNVLLVLLFFSLSDYFSFVLQSLVRSWVSALQLLFICGIEL